MWNKLTEIWSSARLNRARALETQARHRITIAGHKWLGPGETLRIVDVESNGGCVTLALWTNKTSSQMLEIFRPAVAE